MKNKRLRIGTCVRITIGVLFILGGICYFLYPNFCEWKTQKEVNAIIEEFHENRDNIIEDATAGISDSEASESEESENKSHVSVEKELSSEELKEELKKTVLPELYTALEQYNQNLINSGQQILDAWSYEQSPVDIRLLNDGSAVIGYLEIPDMKVKLPLYLGASSDNLSQGAAVMSQTSMPIGGNNTNCVIAGHRGYRGSAFFQYIDKAQVGSKVYITNPWETLTYQVVGTKIVHPNQVDDIMIQQGKDMVTLVSCHPYQVGGGPERYLVFCERIATEQTVENPSTEVDESESESSSDVVESTTSGETDVQTSTSVDTNELQEWESCLRIFAPMIVIFISCIILFIRCSKKSRRK